LLIVFIVVVLIAAIAIVLYVRKLRTERLRNRVEDGEYSHIAKKVRSWREAEAALDERP
jgi:hypothetical protein